MIRRTMRSVRLLVVAALCCVLGAGIALAEEAEARVTEDYEVPPMTEPELSGDDIYRRVLDNRFNSYEQTLLMTSGDRGGNFQTVELEVRYMNFRERSKKIVSKTIAKYQAPQDVRHLGYLVINKHDGSDDQFVFRPSSRRVRRVNLRGEAVSGTDFSFEDVLPAEFEDASYERLPDERVSEIDTYVIQVFPVENSDSEYSKMVTWVDKTNYVPLRTRYWDNRDVAVKELTSDPKSIEEHTDEEKGEEKRVWLAHNSRMQHLKLGTWTELKVDELQANPGLKPKHFSERELARSH